MPVLSALRQSLSITARRRSSALTFQHHRRALPSLFKHQPLARHFASISQTSAMSDAPETYGNFDLIKRVKLDFTDVVVSKWRSRTTGLSVVHLDYEGKWGHLTLIQHGTLTHRSAPIVNGYFVVATESKFPRACSWQSINVSTAVFDDSGCPHTLEQYASDPMMVSHRLIDC